MVHAINGYIAIVIVCAAAAVRCGRAPSPPYHSMHVAVLSQLREVVLVIVEQPVERVAVRSAPVVCGHTNRALSRLLTPHLLLWLLLLLLSPLLLLSLLLLLSPLLLLLLLMTVHRVLIVVIDDILLALVCLQRVLVCLQRILVCLRAVLCAAVLAIVPVVHLAAVHLLRPIFPLLLLLILLLLLLRVCPPCSCGGVTVRAAVCFLASSVCLEKVSSFSRLEKVSSFSRFFFLALVGFALARRLSRAGAALRVLALLREQLVLELLLCLLLGCGFLCGCGCLERSLLCHLQCGS